MGMSKNWLATSGQAECVQVKQQIDQVALMHSWHARMRTADGAAADGVPECGMVDGAPPQLTRLLCAHVPVERGCQLSRPKATMC